MHVKVSEKHEINEPQSVDVDACGFDPVIECEHHVVCFGPNCNRFVFCLKWLM